MVVPALKQALAHQGLEFSAAESLFRLMSATAPTIPLGRMHMRPFQLDVIGQVRTGRGRRSVGSNERSPTRHPRAGM